MCSARSSPRRTGKVFPNLEIDKFYLRGCDVCNQAKATRATFPLDKVGDKKEINEVTHADLQGPLPSGWDKQRHICLAVDHASTWIDGIAIQHKSDTAEAMKDIFRRYQARSPTHLVKMLRTNNGGKFTSKEFEKYLLNHQIDHQTTIPHTPDQNGVIERANRTINNRIRALMIDSGAAANYWPDALNYAIFIHNRLPNTVLNDKLPYEFLTENMANEILSMPYFMLEKWVRIDQKDKFGPRAVKVRVLYPTTDSDGKKAFAVQRIERKDKEGRMFVPKFVGLKTAVELNVNWEKALKRGEVEEEVVTGGEFLSAESFYVSSATTQGTTDEDATKATP